MIFEHTIIITVVLSLINNIWFKVQLTKEKKIGTTWIIGTYVGSFILICLLVWTIFLFWFMGFKTAITCIILYLILSYVLEKMFGFNKISNLKKPWKKID